MKILFVSMQAIHASKWINNLHLAGHELFWFDVLGKGNLETNVSIVQYTNWNRRRIPYIKGEYWFSKKFPKLYKKLQPLFEVTANEKLEQILLDLKPDLVQSFEMHSCSYPIYETMKKYNNIKWMYNCWGSDIFYYQNLTNYYKKILNILERVDYMSADCKRDEVLAYQNGFKGKFLGVIPTGGGYDLSFYKDYIDLFENRKYIIVKGYEHHFGRGLNIVKALETIKDEINGYEVVVFGSHKLVQEYINANNLPFIYYDRHGLSNKEVLKLMGQSLIYIGNSISDGMPNTLLEALIMGAFPIQSNPGGATAEIITNNENGFLIDNPSDINNISNLILKAIKNIIKNFILINDKIYRIFSQLWLEMKNSSLK